MRGCSESDIIGHFTVNLSTLALISLHQDSLISIPLSAQVEKESLTAKIVGLRGKMVYLDTKLARDEEYTNTYIVQLTLPFDLVSD